MFIVLYENYLEQIFSKRVTLRTEVETITELIKSKQSILDIILQQ